MIIKVEGEVWEGIGGYCMAGVDGARVRAGRGGDGFQLPAPRHQGDTDLDTQVQQGDVGLF